jgi:hypothetical protein
MRLTTEDADPLGEDADPLGEDADPLGEDADPLGGTAFRMSLRDWFAGMALTGMLANPDGCSGQYEAVQAGYAYAQADAMLAARREVAK